MQRSCITKLKKTIDMEKRVFMQAIFKVVSGILSVGLCVFLPAGTLSFPNGWLFMGVLFIPMILTGCVLAMKSPEMLKMRLYAKEETKSRKAVIFLTGLMFLAGFILAGLDARFLWSRMPDWISVMASAMYLAGYLVYLEVMRINRYLSRTIRITSGQTVVQTGLYAIVRHPMYGATILMFLSVPLILGSFYAFLIFWIYPFLIQARAKEEEAFLEQNLPGYGEYMKKVRRRFIPFLW